MIWQSHIKTKRPIVPLEERAEIVRAIRYVDEVIVTTTLDKKQVWEKVHFNEIYIGDDWKGNARWEKTGKEMEELGAKLVFLPYTKDTSSTMLREKLKEFQGARYEKKNKKEIKKLKKSINKINKVRVQKGRKAMLQETWATVTYGLYDNRKIRRLKKFPPALVENRMLFETMMILRIMVVLC